MAKKIETGICTTCKKEFVLKYHQKVSMKTRPYWRLFCSVECAHKKGRPFQRRTCLCGNTFEVLRGSKDIFCSGKCWGEYRQFTYTQEGLEALRNLPVPVPFDKFD